MEVFSRSDIGLVRNENQDSCSFSVISSSCVWAVVCDGMGGMQGGSVASQLAVQTILETVASADKQSNPSMTLIKAIRNANMAIIEEGQNNPELQGMGTTVTALLLTPYSAITAYVGDSRIYQLRDGKKIFDIAKADIIADIEINSYTKKPQLSIKSIVYKK